ncbi:hypothetical protein [Heyndrickxia coagulans]|nr:hypothetical protein [Heyndrickxia coagulans]
MESKEAEDPAEVSMVKKDGKWTVWQENDYTNELEEAFAGGEVY